MNPPRSNSVPWIIGLVLFCFCGWFVMPFAMMFMGRGVTEEDYAHDVTDREVTAAALGASGSVTLEDYRYIKTIDLRSGEVKQVAALERGQFVATLSGRDAQGRVAAFVATDKNSDLVLYTPGKAPKTLLSVPGDPLWDHTIGDHLELAGRAPLIVFGRGNGSEQYHNPQALLEKIDFYKVNAETGKETRLGVTGYSDSFVLTSNGDRLYFIAGADRSVVAWINRPSSGEPPRSGSEPVTPAVYEFNLKTSQLRPICRGWDVFPTESDEALLVRDYDQNLTRFNIRTGKSEAFGRPGYDVGALGLAAANILITEAKQVRKEDVQLTKSNGLPGPRPQPRVVGICSEKQAVTTFYKSIDPRNQVTFSAF